MVTIIHTLLAQYRIGLLVMSYNVCGFTHQPAIELGKKLIEITPENLQQVFFDSGSVSPR